MKNIAIITVLIFTLSFWSCTKEEIDDLKPQIDLTIAGAYPVNCSTVQRGSTLNFKAKFTDNVALGSYSVDLHHNFDHHNHSTSVETCNLGPIKTPISPFTFIQDYTIPSGQTEYIATGSILIPNNIDAGDYHFMYKVTDASGWQMINGFSIKIVE